MTILSSCQPEEGFIDELNGIAGGNVNGYFFDQKRGGFVSAKAPLAPLNKKERGELVKRLEFEDEFRFNLEAACQLNRSAVAAVLLAAWKVEPFKHNIKAPLNPDDALAYWLLYEAARFDCADFVAPPIVGYDESGSLSDLYTIRWVNDDFVELEGRGGVIFPKFFPSPSWSSARAESQQNIGTGAWFDGVMSRLGLVSDGRDNGQIKFNLDKQGRIVQVRSLEEPLVTSVSRPSENLDDSGDLLRRADELRVRAAVMGNPINLSVVQRLDRAEILANAGFFENQARRAKKA